MKQGWASKSDMFTWFPVSCDSSTLCLELQVCLAHFGVVLARAYECWTCLYTNNHNCAWKATQNVKTSWTKFRLYRHTGLYLPACVLCTSSVNTVDMLVSPFPLAKALVAPAALEWLVRICRVCC